MINGPAFNTSMFFLLSGFIYSILFSDKERVPKLKPFMKERFLRLYPLHIICTLIVFATILYRTDILSNTVYAIKSLALHISLLWVFVPKLGHSLNQPSWALSVFFLCYALTPACSRFLNSQNKKSLWLLFFSAWAILILPAACFKELPRYFSGINFFSGMLLGRLFLNNAISLPKKAILNDLLLLLAAILLCVNIYYFKPINSNIAYYVISPAVYSALLLLLSNNKGFIVKILSASWLKAVGKASFYPYLLHCVVIGFLHLYLQKVLQWKDNPFNNLHSTLIIMVLLYGSCALYSQIKLKRKK
jgi:peptidoglycan/LPS O-acetylase OafA/YrhL